MNPITVVTKTTYIPGECDIRTLKDEYVRNAPIKVATFRCQGVSVSTRGESDPELIRYLNNSIVCAEKGTHFILSHTDFHLRAIYGRFPKTPSCWYVNVVDLASAIDGRQPSSLEALGKAYANRGRVSCNFAEGAHTMDELVQANEHDARLIEDIYTALHEKAPEAVLAYIKSCARAA